jgi:hypothetical protein
MLIEVSKGASASEDWRWFGAHRLASWAQLVTSRVIAIVATSVGRRHQLLGLPAVGESRSKGVTVDVGYHSPGISRWGVIALKSLKAGRAPARRCSSARIRTSCKTITRHSPRTRVRRRFETRTADDMTISAR